MHKVKDIIHFDLTKNHLAALKQLKFSKHDLVAFAYTFVRTTEIYQENNNVKFKGIYQQELATRYFITLTNKYL